MCQTSLEPSLPPAELQKNYGVGNVNKEEDQDQEEDVYQDEVEWNSVADDALNVLVIPSF